MNPTLEVIFSRKSVRHFTGAPVSREQLLVLAKAGMAAPSAKNMQPWKFIALTDHSLMDQLAEGLPFAKMLKEAGGAIVVCGNNQNLSPVSHSEIWSQDCAAATQNILLAAESMGLGAVWTACYPYPTRYGLVQKVLGLPDYIIPFSVVPIGIPTGEDVPKDKFLAENLIWERWGS